MALNTRAASVAETDPASFGAGTGFVFTVNTTVGAGFLGLPWAYLQGGWVLCVALQVFIALLGWLMSLMLLEVMSRAEAITRLREEGYNIPSLGCKHLCGKKVYDNDLYLIPNAHKPEITHRRFDMTELVRIYFGENGVYICLLYCYSSGTLVAFASVFASSFAANVPLGPLDTCDIYKDSSLSCEWKYLTYVCIFSVFMLYFTIVGLKEQFWMQICMTVLRIVVMTLVIAACLAAALTNTHIDSVLYNPADIPAAVDFGAIGKALPVIVFASMYQTSLPSIVEQMRNKDKTVPKVLAWTTVTSLFFYLLLGLIVPIAIPDVPSQCSMAFRNYTAGHKVDHRPWWTYALGYLVVIFPALDVFSSFPLASVALADNLQSLVYGSVPRNSIPRVGFYGVKLFACVPALVVAMLAHNLGTVLDWAGLFGFFLVLFMIPLCHLAGRKVLPIESQYDVRRLPRVNPRQCANWVVAVLVVPLAVIVALEMV